MIEEGKKKIDNSTFDNSKTHLLQKHTENNNDNKFVKHESFFRKDEKWGIFWIENG